MNDMVQLFKYDRCDFLLYTGPVRWEEDAKDPYTPLVRSY